MARELDSILDQFLTKGYEVCDREYNAIELHREHGVCIKIKKNLIDYSVYIKVHSQIKLIGTVARHIIKLVIDELGSDIITGSSYNYSQVEIRVPSVRLAYRQLEQIVDIFYMRFTADYLGLIQSQQMGEYRKESINNSYEALSSTNVSSGETRDYSHEGRVHHHDAPRSYDPVISHTNTNVKVKKYLTCVTVCVAIFFIIAIAVASCINNTYDVYGYFINKYDSTYGYELTVSNSKDYDFSDSEFQLYEYTYEYGPTYTMVQNDIDNYIEYLESDWDFRVFGGVTFNVYGQSYDTTYLSYQDDCYIYFGYTIDTCDNYGTEVYTIEIVFVCEYYY